MIRRWEEAVSGLLAGRVALLVIAGPVGAGKTRAAEALARYITARGHRVGGVVSPRTLRRGETVGYRVRDLATGEERPLCALTPPGLRFGRFYFAREGLEFAREAIIRAAREAEFVVVDEVGPLELEGHGFAPGIVEARASGKPLAITARPRLVDAVLDWLGVLEGTRIIELPRAPHLGLVGEEGEG
ncbi:nucleoside-triphosphatase [Candidatus Bipolaricaulota sp. J31]